MTTLKACEKSQVLLPGTWTLIWQDDTYVHPSCYPCCLVAGVDLGFSAAIQVQHHHLACFRTPLSHELSAVKQNHIIPTNPMSASVVASHSARRFRKMGGSIGRGWLCRETQTSVTLPPGCGRENQPDPWTMCQLLILSCLQQHS